MSKRSLETSNYHPFEGELAERISDSEEDNAAKKPKYESSISTTTNENQYTSEMLNFANDHHNNISTTTNGSSSTTTNNNNTSMIIINGSKSLVITRDEQPEGNNQSLSSSSSSTSSNNSTERNNASKSTRTSGNKRSHSPDEHDDFNSFTERYLKSRREIFNNNTDFVDLETFEAPYGDDDEQFARALQNSLNDDHQAPFHGDNYQDTTDDHHSSYSYDIPICMQKDVKSCSVAEFSSLVEAEMKSYQTDPDDYYSSVPSNSLFERRTTKLQNYAKDETNKNLHSSKHENNFKNNSNEKNYLHVNNNEGDLPVLQSSSASDIDLPDSTSTTTTTNSSSTLAHDSRKKEDHKIDFKKLTDQFQSTHPADQQQDLEQKPETNNLLNIMPIQSATEGSESSDRPTLTTQTSKRLQQVTSVNSAPTTSPVDNAAAATTTTLEQNNNTAPHVNSKITRLFSDAIEYKHLMCINPKSTSESFYRIHFTLDAKSPYTSKSEQPTKQMQLMVSGKSDLKKLVEIISDHTTLPITTVCFKKTLGERQRIIPLSTSISLVFEKITLQKPVILFINGDESIELDFNNMYVDAGNELYREKKFVEAIECYNVAGIHYPNDSRVFSNRALCLNKLGRFNEAFKDSSTTMSMLNNDSALLAKVYNRRALAASGMLTNFTPDEEVTNIINSQFTDINFKDESLETKLNYICLKDTHSYLKTAGMTNEYSTVMALKKKEVEYNDEKLIKTFYYLLHNAPKVLDYCLIKKRHMKDLKQTTVFPSTIYSPEDKDPQIYTPLPFCSREWYESEMAKCEELFTVKLWKPFYDNNETIHGKQMPSQDIYKFIIFTVFKYLLSKPDFATLLKNENNFRIFSRIIIYLAFGAGSPPKAYLYINNKSEETKVSMREFVHQGSIEYVHVQVRDFHFIVEFKQPAASTFSATDTNYCAKENRIHYGNDLFTVRVGDKLPSEIVQ